MMNMVENKRILIFLELEAWFRYMIECYQKSEQGGSHLPSVGMHSNLVLCTISPYIASCDGLLRSCLWCLKGYLHK